MPTRRTQDAYGGRFAVDPAGSSILSGYQQATRKQDLDMVRRNLEPYTKHGFTGSIKTLRGMSDEEIRDMATKAVLAKRKGTYGKTKPDKPKPSKPKPSKPRGGAKKPKAPTKPRVVKPVQKPKIKVYKPQPKPKYQPPPTKPTVKPRQTGHVPPKPKQTGHVAPKPGHVPPKPKPPVKYVPPGPIRV